MEYNVTNEFVTCPFVPHHRVLQTRLPIHIERCRKNYKGEPLVVCPYNCTHFMKQEELANHTIYCKSAKKTRMRQNIEPVTPAPPRPILDGGEEWDNEPPVPPYNPADYCKNNLIMRYMQGKPRAARREFRESERLRFNYLSKKQENPFCGSEHSNSNSTENL